MKDYSIHHVPGEHLKFEDRQILARDWNRQVNNGPRPTIRGFARDHGLPAATWHREYERGKVGASVPDQRDGFAKKLYATYLSYLPEDQFAYPLTMHVDNRGSFTEILHTAERGQVSVNVSRPGITKGQHWHHTKHEKFLVVSGEGAIRFRKMDDPSAQVITYRVSGAKLEVVRIPPGYTHNIENLGTTDMVTVMWANEVFDPQRPDTFREEV